MLNRRHKAAQFITLCATGSEHKHRGSPSDRDQAHNSRTVDKYIQNPSMLLDIVGLLECQSAIQLSFRMTAAMGPLASRRMDLGACASLGRGAPVTVRHTERRACCERR